MTRWNLSIPEKTDRVVRTFLARTGGKKGDLSRFVDEAVRRRVLDLTVRQVKDRNNGKGFSLCFRSHQMLIVLLRSRHGFRTVPGDVRELSDFEKLVSIAVRQAGGPVFGSN